MVRQSKEDRMDSLMHGMEERGSFHRESSDRFLTLHKMQKHTE